MKISNLFQKNKKSRLVTAAVLGLLLMTQIFAVAANGQSANIPAFNIYTPYSHTQAEGRDYFLLDAKNETKNTGWGFPVSAEPGDVIVLSAYYHNSVLESTAKNTRLKINLPLSGGLSHSIGAALWADNASNATPSAPMVQNMGINVSSAARLERIAGSVRWYPNQKDWGVDPSTALPFGQNGDELFSSAGLNVGDIRGCWEFSGYIIFKLRVVGEAIVVPQNPDLSISKSVRNQSTGSGLTESVNAENGQRVQFQIEVRNSGDTTLSNVMLRDSLPNSLDYVSGTLRLDSSAISDQIFAGGVNIGSLSAGQSRTMIFEAIVDAGNVTATLTNTAFTRADQVGERSDSASVCVSYYAPYYPPYYPPVPPPPVPQPSPSPFLKEVANLTRPNGTSFENNALIGEQLRYTLTYTNQSSAIIQNVQIIDVLPSHVSFVDAGNSGSYNPSANSIIWQIGSLAPGATAQVSYRVNVMSGVPYDGFVITNTALLQASNIQVTSNEVRTRVNIPVVKGEVKVRAITGASLAARNLVFSFLLALITVAATYYFVLRKDMGLLRLKWAVVRARMKGF